VCAHRPELIAALHAVERRPTLIVTSRRSCADDGVRVSADAAPASPWASQLANARGEFCVSTRMMSEVPIAGKP